MRRSLSAPRSASLGTDETDREGGAVILFHPALHPCRRAAAMGAHSANDRMRFTARRQALLCPSLIERWKGRS
jgi:hypothetical protein